MIKTMSARKTILSSLSLAAIALAGFAGTAGAAPPPPDHYDLRLQVTGPAPIPPNGLMYYLQIETQNNSPNTLASIRVFGFRIKKGGESHDMAEMTSPQGVDFMQDPHEPGLLGLRLTGNVADKNGVFKHLFALTYKDSNGKSASIRDLTLEYVNPATNATSTAEVKAGKDFPKDGVWKIYRKGAPVNFLQITASTWGPKEDKHWGLSSPSFSLK